MSKKHTVLSLGRLHPLKGLDLLIAAFAAIKSSAKVLKFESAKVEEVTKDDKNAQNFRTLELSNFRTSSWQLVIAGPDEQGMREKLIHLCEYGYGGQEAESEKLKISIAEVSELADAGDADVVFMGPVYGEAKWALMKQADIFVLPSRSENFGIVVGEALSCGVPVVTTAVGPWGEGRAVARPCRGGSEGASDRLPVRMEERGLIVVETSVEGIAQGLRQMMALSDEARQELGRQGREWVKQEFSWERVAKQMIEAYRGGGREDEL